ncbi:DMT family transporter [Mesorhizobium silamurunense]|uniref:DMT family transporter n=1 Tax=Mesorhizobium silamurunense TaxID=499528 RepID=UPI00178122A9|nr:DMT family transporter [Mesorhizobium silamurunense]
MKAKTSGYVFALLTVCTFAALDGFSRLLGEKYSPFFITMVRFWGFAVFVSILAATSPGGMRSAIQSLNPLLQIARGLLLVSASALCVWAYKYAGLATSMAILQVTPLLVTFLSVPLLGEIVGWRRATAVVVGLIGVIIIINPVTVHGDFALLLPVSGAILNALYGVGTRAVGRRDSFQTSALYTGVFGAVFSTVPGVLCWESIEHSDWLPMASLCLTGALGHYFLIRAYAVLEALEVQPLIYLQLLFGIAVAVVFFNEALTWNMGVGAFLVVGSGMFSVWREHSQAKRSRTAIP